MSACPCAAGQEGDHKPTQEEGEGNEGEGAFARRERLQAAHGHVSAERGALRCAARLAGSCCVCDPRERDTHTQGEKEEKLAERVGKQGGAEGCCPTHDGM